MQSYTFKNQFTTKIEYIKTKSSETNKFTVIYLHGLCSTPWGRKGDSVKAFCQEHNLPFIRYEMIGHCSDQANYEQADISIWKEQALEIIDDVAETPVLLVGQSMGGWLSFLCALKRPEKVVGIVGTAAALDFTQLLYDHYFDDAQRQELVKNGKINVGNKDFTYVFTKQLIDSGLDNCLLENEIDIKCPVHLIQGMDDASYPWEQVLKIAKKIKHDQVVVKLLKGSNHRLQQDRDIKEIFLSIESFM